MQEMTLQEMQAAQFDVLKRVDAICREQGIKYWVGFGTLLGAVRHKGFIPWDDDIDLLFMREDYNKLADYFLPSGERNGLHYDSVATRKNYPYYIARISETSS
ncbi:MAG: LicD family protein, partial [Synergistaceae bacterium]|nr:LicD family protein [Synergistaceae bacterium]